MNEEPKTRTRINSLWFLIGFLVIALVVAIIILVLQKHNNAEQSIPESVKMEQSEIDGAKEETADFAKNLPDKKLQADDQEAKNIIGSYEAKIEQAEGYKKLYYAYDYAEYYYNHINANIELALSIIVRYQEYLNSDLLYVDYFNTLNKLYTLDGDTARAEECAHRAEEASKRVLLQNEEQS